MAEAGTCERLFTGDIVPDDKLLPAVGSAPRTVPGLWPWTRGKSNRTRPAGACPSDRCPRLHRGDATA